MDSPYAARVTVAQPAEIQSTLDAAVEAAVQEALGNPGHGVLVTRHDHRTFTVELSGEVPQGTISELDLRPPH